MQISYVAIAAAVLGALALLWRSLPMVQGATYRYEDELTDRRIPTGWFAPVTVICALALAFLWSSRPALAVVYTLVAVPLVLLSLIDFDVYRLPNSITYPLALALAAALLVVALTERSPQSWVRAMLAGLALGAIYFVLVLIAPGGGMGLGDAKLAPSLGMLLGYLGWEHVMLGTFLGFVSGALMGGALMIFTSAGRKSHLAFGPHMIIGALLVLMLAGRAAQVS